MPQEWPKAYKLRIPSAVSAVSVVVKVNWARTCISVTGGMDSRRSGEPISGPLSDSLTTFSAAVLLPLVNIFPHLKLGFRRRRANCSQIDSHFHVTLVKANAGVSTTPCINLLLWLTSEPPHSASPSPQPPDSQLHRTRFRDAGTAKNRRSPDHREDPTPPARSLPHAPNAPRITRLPNPL
jgi:hypothetical protein